jgi:hypothetical protein
VAMSLGAPKRDVLGREGKAVLSGAQGPGRCLD